ncbi:MAG: HlyC/CorC family transporter [Candidatus Omnitrophica bacterium]|nr:HlyC/CorC family transporter [Candidatus Omnitrophota bacterium]
MPILTALLLLLALSAFFSLSETSFMALSRLRLRHLVAQGRRRAKIIQGIVNRLDHFLATILLANNFVNIAFTSLATAFCVTALGEQWGVTAATLGTTALILIFGEITPKVAAAQHAERIALWTAPLMRAFVWLLGPVTTVLTRISRLVLRALGVPLKSRAPFITEEEIRLMIEIGKEEGVLGEQERQLLHRIFEFGDTKVAEAMVPLAQVAMVSSAATHDQVLEAFTEEGYSKILVCEGDDRARVVGVIHTHDLLHLWKNEGLIATQDLIRPVYAVPPDTRVSDLLKEFQTRKIQLAVVTNPQGLAVGLVTLEDLVEEIVGDIE